MESLLTTTEIAKKCPKRISANSVWRWCRRGVKSRGGEVIRLRHVRMGGIILIPEPALNEFFEALAAADAIYFADVPKPVWVSNVKRGKRTAHEQAVAMLAKRGL